MGDRCIRNDKAVLILFGWGSGAEWGERDCQGERYRELKTCVCVFACVRHMPGRGGGSACIRLVGRAILGRSGVPPCRLCVCVCVCVCARAFPFVSGDGRVFRTRLVFGDGVYCFRRWPCIVFGDVRRVLFSAMAAYSGQDELVEPPHDVIPQTSDLITHPFIRSVPFPPPLSRCPRPSGNALLVLFLMVLSLLRTLGIVSVAIDPYHLFVLCAWAGSLSLSLSLPPSLPPSLPLSFPSRRTRQRRRECAWHGRGSTYLRKSMRICCDSLTSCP